MRHNEKSEFVIRNGAPYRRQISSNRVTLMFLCLFVLQPIPFRAGNWRNLWSWYSRVNMWGFMSLHLLYQWEISTSKKQLTKRERMIWLFAVCWPDLLYRLPESGRRLKTAYLWTLKPHSAANQYRFKDCSIGTCIRFVEVWISLLIRFHGIIKTISLF